MIQNVSTNIIFLTNVINVKSQGYLKDGFDVFFVSDCSGGITTEAHEDAKLRMVQAGAKPISWLAVINEWTPDYPSPERAALADVTRQRGGSAALLYDYMIAQVRAGLVPPLVLAYPFF